MDSELLHNIGIFSSLKAIEKSPYTGILDLTDIAFMTAIKTYLNTFSSILSYEQVKSLNNLMIKIQFGNNEICNYSTNEFNIQSNTLLNTPPVITNIEITYDADYYDITKQVLISTFTDVDGDLPEEIKILSLPSHGTFTYNNNNVTVGQIINLSSFGTLRFTRTVLSEIVDNFNFKISDNNPNKLFSNMGTMTINIIQAVNQPPDNVGVNSLNLDSASIHVFTKANFTTQTTPPYSDPEGDIPSLIKITLLPTNGKLKYNNVDIILNQNIPYSELDNGVFTYESNSLNNSSHVDTFTFSMSDIGSQSFTSGGNFTLNIAAYVNQPPTVGDSTITINEGDLLIFTRAMFLTNSDPSYSDPEGDPATSIRFPTLPAEGLIKLSNVNVTVNQEIALTSVDNGLLTYTQSSNSGGTMSDFEFNIKDSNNNWSN